MSQLKSFLGSPAGLMVCSTAAALGAYLLIYHLAHVALALPYLALLACPLMHLTWGITGDIAKGKGLTTCSTMPSSTGRPEPWPGRADDH